LQLGKGGLSGAFVEQIKNIFEKERVLKITILRSCCRDKKKAEAIGEELVSRLGSKFGFKLVGYVLTVVKYRKVQG
jgi:RNA-binding protein YhbY